jgi:hypothetical protein
MSCGVISCFEWKRSCAEAMPSPERCVDAGFSKARAW